MAITYKEEFETKLQERLSENNKWKEVCKVIYTNANTLHNPYLTDATVATGTRGAGYTSTAVATTDDTVVISDFKISAMHIDRADLAQKTFSDWMEIADNMAIKLNEAIETAMLASHAQFTNFDNASIGGAAGNITVSESNIDDIITGMQREIREANGDALMERDGTFIIWRAADFEKVQKYAAAQGFSTADDVLKNGIKQGFRYLGVEHYSSNKHTAGHVFGGVKKALTVGIVKSTYGLMTEIMNPYDVVSAAQISGVGLESRVDYKFKAFANMAPVLFDILVA